MVIYVDFKVNPEELPESLQDQRMFADFRQVEP